MRDLVLLTVFFAALPIALVRPVIGAMLFAWISLMNPHRLTWGVAFDMPLAQLAAVATLAGFAVAGLKGLAGASRAYFLMILFVAWMGITTYFSLVPGDAAIRYQEVLKTQVMVLVTFALLQSRRHIEIFTLIWMISLGFYGIKGGLFTIISGGNHRVFGPPSSNIEENNSLAIAMLMVAPLFLAHWQHEKHRWLRIAHLSAALLCFVSAAGSHSRGALIAIAATLAFVWLHSSRKLVLLAVTAVLLLGMASTLPENWWARMQTIDDFDQDASAQGRINTWITAFRIANDRITGAGFEYYKPSVFAVYAPDPDDVKAAHSIYFQALGEHGWIGLALYISFWTAVWLRASTFARRYSNHPEWGRAAVVVSYSRASIVALASGGAFLNLGNWDGSFFLAVIILAYVECARRHEGSANAQPGANSLARGHQLRTVRPVG